MRERERESRDMLAFFHLNPTFKWSTVAPLCSSLLPASPRLKYSKKKFSLVVSTKQTNVFRNDSIIINIIIMGLPITMKQVRSSCETFSFHVHTIHVVRERERERIRLLTDRPHASSCTKPTQCSTRSLRHKWRSHRIS